VNQIFTAAVTSCTLTRFVTWRPWNTFKGKRAPQRWQRDSCDQNHVGLVSGGTAHITGWKLEKENPLIIWEMSCLIISYRGVLPTSRSYPLPGTSEQKPLVVQELHSALQGHAALDAPLDSHRGGGGGPLSSPSWD